MNAQHEHTQQGVADQPSINNQTRTVNHLAYRARDYYDIVNRFSTENYELLNDGFAAYLDQVQPTIEKEKPVVMQITGAEFSSDEKQAIDRAIWSHYRLRLSEASVLMRGLRIKTFWFAVSFVLSWILLFFVGSTTEEVFVQFLYIPFYFFGYRMITYPIFDYLPARRHCKKISKMASMCLLFTKEPLEDVPQEYIQKAYETEKEYQRLVREGIANKEMVRKFFVEDDVVVIECRIESASDVVSPASVPGHELLSLEMSSYLEQVEPFVTQDSPIDLVLKGCSITQDEEKAICAAIENHYDLRIKETKHGSTINWQRTGAFAICLVLISTVLYLWGSALDIVGHECIVIALWFFADYLVEFVLLEGMALSTMRRKWENIQKMRVVVN